MSARRTRRQRGAGVKGRGSSFMTRVNDGAAKAGDFLRKKMYGDPGKPASAPKPSKAKAPKAAPKSAPTGGVPLGGVAGAAVYAAGDALIPHISREAVRGALVVTGQDTTGFDNLNSGIPVVKNVGGVSYNIATPEGLAGYQKAMRSGEKPSAPAKPAEEQEPSTYTVSGVTYNSDTGRPVDAPEGGYSLTPEGDMVPHSSKPDDGARVNANGLVSYGKDLSSLNKFTSDFTGGYQIADVKTAFQSEDLPMKGSEGTNTDYSLGDAEAMGVSKPDALTISQGGFVETLIEPSTPGTTGNNPVNAQDGTSPAPNIAESVRTLRMQRKGPRDDGGPRGFAIDRNNRLASMPQEEAPDEAKIAQQNRRNQIRSTFLDMDTPIIQASVAANALAGYGKDSDGNAQFNYGGELVQAKDGMQQQAKNAAMMGRDPSEFLAIKLDAVKKDTKETK